MNKWLGGLVILSSTVNSNLTTIPRHDDVTPVWSTQGEGGSGEEDGKKTQPFLRWRCGVTNYDL